MDSRNQNSFSLQFNPISNVRSIKEYENEIKDLKNEIFDLKTQIAHGNSGMSKILFDNNYQIEQLTNENKELREKVEKYKGNFDRLNNENKILSDKLSMSDNKNNEEVMLLKFENRKLITRVEKLTNNSVEIVQLKDTMHDDQVQIENLKNIILKLENDIQILNGEKEAYERALIENRGKVQTLEAAISNTSHGKFIENESMKNSINEKNSILSLKDKTIKEFEFKLNAINNKNEQLEKNYSMVYSAKVDFEKKFNEAEKEILSKEALIISQKDAIREIKVEMKQTFYRMNEKIFEAIKLSNSNEVKYFISQESIKFCKKINCYGETFNEILLNIKGVIKSKMKENLLLEQKISGIIKSPNMGNSKFIEDLSSRIKEGMEELEVYRKYIKEKAEENKILKNENLKLKSQQSKNVKQIENAKRFYEGIKSKYGEKALLIK